MPPAVRTKAEGIVGHTVGCYPESVVGQLLEIQNLRRQGWAVEKIKSHLGKPTRAVSFVEEKGTISNKIHQTPLTSQVSGIHQGKRGQRLWIRLGIGVGAVAVVVLSTLVTTLIAGTGWKRFDLLKIESSLTDGEVLAAQTATNSAYLEINADAVFNGKVNLPSTNNSFTINTNEDTNFLTVVGGVTLDQNLSKTSSPTFNSLTLSASSKQLTLQNSNLVTFPQATGTVVYTDNTQTLTNKSLSGGSNTFTNIPNSALSNSKVTINAGTNLSGGGDVSLGSSVTLALKDNISIASATISGNLGVVGLATVSGMLSTGGNFMPLVNGVQDIGSSSLVWNNIYANNVISGSSGTSGFWQLNSGAIAPANTTNSLLIGDSATTSAKFQVYGLSALNPVASISGSSSKAALMVDNTVGDLFTASSSGLNRFVIAQNGNVGIGTSAPAYKLDVNGSTNIASGLTIAAGNLNFTGSQNIDATAIMQIGTSNQTSLTLGRVGAPTTINGSTVTIGATQLTLNNATDSGTLGVGGEASFSAKITLDSLTAQINATNMRNLDLGFMNTGRVEFLNTSNYIDQSNNLYLGGNLISSGSQVGFWQRPASTGVLSPVNITDSVIVGRQATATASGAITSGQIQLYGVNNLNPVASISAVSAVAALVVDNRNGDLFTASSSGLNRFVITQNGNVGIGTSIPVATFHNAGGTLFTALAVSDLATGGDIGTAANTVDKYTTFNLTQTTTGQTITLPTPTNTTAGRLVYLSNTGSASFTFLSSSVQTGTTTAAVWNGSAWTLAGGGGLSPGTVANSTLRWNSTISQWVENSQFLSQSTGITPVASVAGQTAFAAMVVDNKGVGDIFTASSSGLNRFVITQNGNVGIGTTVPSQKLSVAGAVQIGSALGSNDLLNTAAAGGAPSGVLYWGSRSVCDSSGNCSGVGGVVGGTGTTNYLARWTSTTNIGTGLLYDNGNGVAINTTVPLAFFDIESSGTSSAIASISGKAARAALVVDNSGTGDILAASSSGLSRFVVTQNGNVGIGTAVPSQKLSVAGAIQLGSSLGSNDVLNTAAAGGAPSGVLYWGSRSVCDSSGNCSGVGGVVGGTGTTNYLARWTSTTNIGTGLLYDNGNGVALNTTVPLASFDVEISTTSAIASISGKAALAALIVDNSGTGDIFTASSSGLNRFVITQSGNVGIGTTTPGGSLIVNSGSVGIGTTTPSTTLHLYNTAANPGIQFTSASRSTLLSEDNSLGGLRISGSNQALFMAAGIVNAGNTSYGYGYTDSTASFRFGTQGNVLPVVPASTGAQGLVVKGLASQTANLQDWQNSSGNVLLGVDPSGFLYNSGAVTGLNKIPGSVGINDLLTIAATSAAYPAASVSANTGQAAVVIDQQGTGDLFTASVSGLTKFVVTNSGNVGIGTAIPSVALDVVGAGKTSGAFTVGNALTVSAGNISLTGSQTIDATGTLTIGGTSQTSLSLGRVGAATTINGSTVVVNGATFNSAGTTTFTGGNVGIGTSTVTDFKLELGGNIGPVTTDLYDLGSAALEWNNLYVKNLVITGTGGGFWQRNTGVLAPTNITDSVIVGRQGTATASGAITSGQIQLYGVNNLNPVASISAVSAVAAMVIDNSVGDLFTASSSGLSRFVITQSGNVGIGTTVPGARLELLASTAGDGIRLTGSTTGTKSPAYSLYDSTTARGLLGLAESSAHFSSDASAGDVVLRADTGKLFIQTGTGTSSIAISSGNVGVGTTVPGKRLAVLSATAADGIIVTNSAAGSGAVVDLQSSDTGGITWRLQSLGNVSGRVGNFEIADLGTSSSPFTIVKTSGNVGIGTTSPIGLLHVQGVVTGKALATFNQNGGDQAALTASVSGTTKFVINNSGQVGVGTGANNNTLLADVDIRANSGLQAVASVSGKTGLASLIVDNSGTGDIFTASSSGLNRFVITQNGNVGIGPSNPVGQLHISTDGTDAGRGVTLDQHNSGIQAALFNFRKSRGTLASPTTVANSDYTGVFFFQNYDGTAYRYNGGFGAKVNGIVGTNSVPTDIFFYTSAASDNDPYTNGHVRLLIDSAGNVGIGTTTTTDFKMELVGGSHFGPSTDNSSDLGSSTLRWRNLYAYNIVSPLNQTGQNGYWQRASGVLAPNSITDSVIVGQTATPSGAITTGSIQLYGVNNLTPVASISAVSAVAAMVVDNSVGDLFTASSSGLNRFVITQNGNVGIGTTVPGGILELQGIGLAGSYSKSLRIAYNSSNYIDLRSGSAGGLILAPPSGSASLTLTGSGTIKSNGGSGETLTLTSQTGGGALLQSAGNGSVTLQVKAKSGQTADLQQWQNSSGAGLDVVDINGNVGIGTTAPIGLLHVQGAVTGKALATFNQNGGDQAAFTASVSGTTKFVINNLGQVGIGTGANNNTLLADVDIRQLTSNSFVASISGSTGKAALTVDNTVGDLFTASSSGLNRFVITQNGNVGIGSSAPGAQLDVLAPAGTIPLFLKQNQAHSGTPGMVQFSDSAGVIGAIGVYSATGELLMRGNNNLVLTVGTALGTLGEYINSNGNVGIGTSNPTKKLEVYNGDYQSIFVNTSNTVGGGISLKDTDTGGRQFSILSTGSTAGAGAGTLSVFDDTGNAYRFTINASGNVGIGTTSPVGLLHVQGVVTGKALATFNQNGGDQAAFTASVSGTTKFVINNSGQVGIGTGANNNTLLADVDIRALTSNAFTASVSASSGKATLTVDNTVGDLFTASSSGLSRFVITQNGNVGIGTTKPQVMLETGTNGVFRIQGGTNAANGYPSTGQGLEMVFSTDINAAGSAGSGTGFVSSYSRTGSAWRELAIRGSDTSFWQLGVEAMRITSTGIVGINTTTPAAIFDVRGTQGTSTLSQVIPVASFSGQTSFAAMVVNNNSTVGDLFTASVSGLNRFVIKNNGNVGIGSTVPAAILDIASSLTATNYLNISSGGSSLFTVSDTAITNALPTSFTAAGDVAIAYDINFTNPTSSFIKSAAPLYLQAGETFNSSDLTLKTFNKGLIQLAPNEAVNITGAATVSGQTVLGTATPTFTPAQFGKLYIQDSGTATAAAVIYNSGTGSTQYFLTMKSAATTVTGVHFIDILDLNGKTIGTAKATSATVATWQSGGIDLAEYMKADDSYLSGGKVVDGVFDQGKIICQGSSGVVPCQGDMGTKIAGVMSLSPAFLGGEEGPNKVMVGLVGQLPVKLATDSAQVNSGDMIAIAAGGLGKKITSRGYTVGKAVASGAAGSTVMVLVNPSYYEGDDLNLASKKSVDEIQSQVASLAATLNLGGLGPLGNVDIASFSAELATISGDLTVLGKTQLAETSIGGPLQVGLLHFDDLSASINSLTGLVTVEGNLKVTGGIILKDKTTGEDYCVEIDKGEIVKRKGECQ